MELSPLLIALKIAVVSTLIVFVLGLLAAGFVSGLRRGKTIADAILSLPLVLPPTVAGYFILILFGRNGILGDILDKLDIRVVFTWQGAALATAVVSFPIMYRGARGAIEQVDRNIIYAARTLGMNEFKVFCKVILPEAGPGIAAAAVLSFARALGEFGATIMVAGNIPGKTRTMSTSVYTAMQSGNRELAYKWVLVILAYSFVILLIMDLFINRRKCK